MEFVLNAKLYTRYLHELNPDGKSRNRLALDAETGLKAKAFMAEAHMRAVVAATVIKVVRTLCQYVSPRLSWTMWDVVRVVLAGGELVAGTAHAAIRRGIATRVPSVLPALDAYLARTETKRNAVVALYKRNDMAVYMMGHCGGAMVARVFGNKQVCPRDMTANIHLEKVSQNNCTVESMFGRTKDVEATLEHCSFVTASGVAAVQLGGTFASEFEVALREKKSMQKLGLKKTVGASHRRSKYIRPIDLLPEEDVDALLKFAVSKKGHAALIAEPLRKSREAQAQATLVRKQKVAAAIARSAERRAIAFQEQVTQTRAQSVAELDAMLEDAAAAEVKASAAAERTYQQKRAAKAKPTAGLSAAKRTKAAAREARLVKSLAKRVEKAKRTVLRAQIRLRRKIWSDDRSLPIVTVGGKARGYDELKRLVDEYIEAEPANRMVPVAPDVVVSTELASCVTDLALQLHIAREQQLQAARKEFFKRAPANRRVELGEADSLPPTVHSMSHGPRTLEDAGLAAGARVWSGTQVFKIVDPYFLNATGAELVCLIYPTDAYDEEEEADMKANPAAFGRALVCEHARVLSWLGFVTADIEEGAGSGAEAARPAPEAVCAHAPRCAATLGM